MKKTLCNTAEPGPKSGFFNIPCGGGSVTHLGVGWQSQIYLGLELRSTREGRSLIMNVLKIAATLFLLLIIATAGCGKSDDPNRHYEKEGGFSYVPPEGWEMSEYPGMKYKIFRGPMENQFAPNINVIDEKLDGSLKTYVDANIEAMRDFVEGFNLVEREEIVTNEGARSIKLTVDGEHYQRQLRQYFCFFDAGERKYIVTCSALAENAEKYEPLFDKSVKTFRIE
jgi:hypothetical protein